MIHQIFLGFIFGFTVYLIFTLRKIFFQVQEGQIAVIISFGKAKSIDISNNNLKIYNSGLHLKLPWEKVKKISIKEQILDLTMSESGTMLMTTDGTLLKIEAKLRYTPILTNIYSLLFSMEKPYEHIKNFFNGLMHQEIGKFSNTTALSSDKDLQMRKGTYAILRTERGHLNLQINDLFSNKFREQYGFQFEGIDIIDIIPPEELAQALNAVIHAQTEAEKNFALKEAECEQKLLAAKKGIEIAKSKAKSVKAEILTQAKILEKLNNVGTLQEYIQRRETEVYSEAKLSYIKR